MTIPYRSVFQNFFWFAVMCGVYRLISWVLPIQPLTNRDLLSIAWGYFGGGMTLRYLVNAQAEKAFRRTVEDWDGEEEARKLRRGMGL